MLRARRWFADRCRSDLRDRSGPVERQAAAFDRGEIEHVVDHSSSATPLFVMTSRNLFCSGLSRFLEQVGHPEDRVHRSANLVRHAGEKFRLARDAARAASRAAISCVEVRSSAAIAASRRAASSCNRVTAEDISRRRRLLSTTQTWAIPPAISRTTQRVDP